MTWTGCKAVLVWNTTEFKATAYIVIMVMGRCLNDPVTERDDLWETDSE